MAERTITAELADTTGSAIPVATALAVIRKMEARQESLHLEVELLREKVNAGKVLEKEHGTVALLESTPEDERKPLRLILQAAINLEVESIYVKPQKVLGRVYSMVQINFKNGYFRQYTILKGIVWGYAEPVLLDYLWVDLRDKAAARATDVISMDNDHVWLAVQHGSRYTSLPASFLRDVLVTDVEEAMPAELPGAVGPAAEFWLRAVRGSMQRASYRVVPAKIRRFVSFLGKDLATSDVNSVAWGRWVRWLKSEIKKGRLAHQTARVTYGRAREFVRWLVTNKLTTEIAGLSKSGESALS